MEADVDRRYLTRIAALELDKLALYRGDAQITTDDVIALVAEAIPGSLWAFADAVSERRVTPALTVLDRLLDATPEPVLLAVLHRRVRELLELGDRLAAGERLPAAARAMGINSEFVADTGHVRPSSGPRTSSRPRSTAWSISMRWSREPQAQVRTKHSADWGSVSGSWTTPVERRTNGARRRPRRRRRRRTGARALSA